MNFPLSVLSIQIIHFHCIALFLTSLILQSGCSITKIHHKIHSSPDAILGIEGLYLENFKGKHSVLFSKILIHEINQLSSLKYFAFLPENRQKKVAIVNAKVKSHKVNDQQQILNQTHISLVEKKSQELQNN